MKIIFLIAITMLVGCNNTPNSKADSQTQTEQMAPIGKPSPNNLSVTHKTSAERAKVGEPFEITLTFPTRFEHINARFDTSAQLQLTGKPQITLSKQGDQAASHTVTVIPQSEGIHYLNIFAKELSASHEKPMVIRVIAGDKPIEAYLKVNGELSEDEDGEKVIIMKSKKGS